MKRKDEKPVWLGLHVEIEKEDLTEEERENAISLLKERLAEYLEGELWRPAAEVMGKERVIVQKHDRELWNAEDFYGELLPEGVKPEETILVGPYVAIGIKLQIPLEEFKNPEKWA